MTFHFDEKWIYNQYINKYQSIQPNNNEFDKFIEQLISKTNYNIIITTGLKKNDIMDLDFSEIENGKFFYDVIYNPKETDFLRKGKKLKNKTQNGEKMFIYQALASFKIWHGIEPTVDDKVLEIFNND